MSKDSGFGISPHLSSPCNSVGRKSTDTQPLSFDIDEEDNSGSRLTPHSIERPCLEDELKSIQSSLQDLTKDIKDDDDKWVSIVDDTYSMFFLSFIGGPAFYFSAYVFVLKMALFTLLTISILEIDDKFPARAEMDTKVIVAQALILPVAVAMQEDLMSSIFMITNVKYHPNIRDSNPGANKLKFFISCACRFVDGMYSLTVNFIVLITATQVKELLLNFAALQFLQSIDNLALQMAEDGFLGERLEEVGSNVKKAKLPLKTNEFSRSLDTVIFILVSLAFLAAWLLFLFVLSG